MTPSLTGTNHMYVKVNSSQYCEEFCCHKITSSQLNISELVFFYYVNIFCKKLKYWIMPNFSNVWIRPQLVFYHFNFKPKLFSTKKPTQQLNQSLSNFNTYLQTQKSISDTYIEITQCAECNNIPTPSKPHRGQKVIKQLRLRPARHYSSFVTYRPKIIKSNLS